MCVCEIIEGRRADLWGGWKPPILFGFCFLLSFVRRNAATEETTYPRATSNPTCSYGEPHLKCTADHEKNLPELKSLI